VFEKVDGFLGLKGVKLIQFFGTNQYMWYLEKLDENASSPPPPRSGSMFRRVDVESFRDGCEKGYDKKMKPVGLKKAVKEMWECLRSGEDPSDVKRGGLQWHTKKIAVVEEEEPEEEEKKAKKTEKKKASSTGKRKKAEAKRTSATEEKEMKKAKKISEEVKRREEKTAAAAADLSRSSRRTITETVSLRCLRRRTAFLK
jgi:type IV secretory pathway VirB10-like protein